MGIFTLVMPRCLTVVSLAVLATGLLAVAACGDTGLQPGVDENVIDTVTLYAVDGTARHGQAHTIDGDCGAEGLADVPQLDRVFHLCELRGQRAIYHAPGRGRLPPSPKLRRRPGVQ